MMSIPWHLPTKFPSATPHMDQPTFQDELRKLKQRVSELHSMSQWYLRPGTMSQATSDDQRDPFVQQLHGLHAQMSTLKVQMSNLQASLPQLRQPVNGQFPTSQPHQPTVEPSRINLPSGAPAFWQLISALKTDVRHIDERVASLESSQSELEDRIDCLDPHRFTPPGSETGSEVTPAPIVPVVDEDASVQERHDSDEKGIADAFERPVSDISLSIAGIAETLHELGYFDPSQEWSGPE
jgi:chaperonin cofactor prefoldin